MGWNVPNVIRMLGMLGYQPGKGKSENLYQKVIDQKVYAVDVKSESIFMFVDGERITESSDETFQALKDSVEYASVESLERREAEAEPITTKEEPETPANVPSETMQDKPVETKPAKYNEAPAKMPAPSRRQNANSSVVVPGYTREQIETIKNTVAKGATDSELQMFMHVAQTYGLDPFLKEIYYSNQIHAIITSRDGYLKAAQRDPEFDGIQSMAVCENDDFAIDAIGCTVKHSFGKGTRGDVIGAWAICYRAGRKPIIAYASYDEYNQGNQIWKKYKSAMCCKVAEVFALKRQFGISGLVTVEEIGVE